MSSILSSKDNTMSQFGIYVISRGRPGNVEKMKRHLSGPNHTWVVSTSESSAYRLAVAATILEVRHGAGLCESRNAALNDAFSKNLVCVQIDDDLRMIKWWTRQGYEQINISMKTAILRTFSYMLKANLYLGGGMPVKNTNWTRWNEKGYSTLQSVKAFMVIRPTRLRFNEELRLKEDYDFTVQHIKEYGGVVRVLQLIPMFTPAGKREGGCTIYRTGELEKRSIEVLKGLHPGWWTKGRNENEVVLCAPKRYREKKEERGRTKYECPTPRKGIELERNVQLCGCRISVVIPQQEQDVSGSGTGYLGLIECV